MQVAEPAVHVARVGDDDENGARRVRRQRRSSECGGRTPSTVNRRAASLPQGVEDGGKALNGRHGRRQVGELRERG